MKITCIYAAQEHGENYRNALRFYNSFPVLKIENLTQQKE